MSTSLPGDGKDKELERHSPETVRVRVTADSSRPDLQHFNTDNPQFRWQTKTNIRQIQGEAIGTADGSHLSRESRTTIAPDSSQSPASGREVVPDSTQVTQPRRLTLSPLSVQVTQSAPVLGYHQPLPAFHNRQLPAPVQSPPHASVQQRRWNKHQFQHSASKYSVSYADSVHGPFVSFGDTPDGIQRKVNPTDGSPDDHKPMSRQDRPPANMTGSRTTGNDRLDWLTDVSRTGQGPPRHRSGGVPTELPHPPHQPHPMLQTGTGTLFRPPVTGSEYVPGGPQPRLFSPGYTSSPTTPSHFLQPTSSPYSAFYPAGHQFPHGYSGALLSPRSYMPSIDSYSAVLHSMGAHAAHAQSHLPRVPMPPYIGPVPEQPLQRSEHSQPRHELHSEPPLPHHELSRTEPPLPRSAPYPEQQSPGEFLASPQGKQEGSRLSRHRHSPSPSSVDSSSSYKVPTGKEGSLKHRILTRPPDIAIRDSALSAEPRGEAEASSPKRSKSSSSSARSVTPRLEQSVRPASAQLHYPAHFMKGSIIQLANGELKRVEDLRTEDFVGSAEISPDLKVDSSTVVRIDESPQRGISVISFSVGEHRVQVTVDAAIEHPFFVFGQGWSSCSPERTLQRYGLQCHRLSVGDVCISLTHKDVHQAAIARQQYSRQTLPPPSPVVTTTCTATTATEWRIPRSVPGPSSPTTSCMTSIQVQTVETHRTPEDISTSTQAESARRALFIEQSETRKPAATRKRRWSAPDAPGTTDTTFSDM